MVFSFLRQLKRQALNQIRKVPGLEMCIALCHAVILMAQDLRDAVEILSRLDHPTGSRVSEIVEADMLEPCADCCFPELCPHPPVGTTDEDEPFPGMAEFIEDIDEHTGNGYMSTLIGLC